MQELLDRVLRMAHSRMTTSPTAWEACLTELATATLDTFLQYPSIAVTATSLTTSGPGELESMELMLACFSEAGLQGRSLAEQYAIFASYVLAGAAGLARDTTDPANNGTYEWFAGPLQADPSHHPLALSSRDDILALEEREIFFAGINQIIAAAKEKAQNQGPFSQPNPVAPLEHENTMGFTGRPPGTLPN
ncbi:TetR/AcrR family transcriptional regulator C-terminal domain-containing protein [Paeniglutamicibacter kerguelensis]|uniref:Tetracycline repressor TetR C-terminal domain-containing protein n=1 Tax=Paeniglutamicibacter kerguelensis TaxID=254788 RepID=A0ABS4XHC4_9MICC|nr:TetR/AcrR family transcriptional regulator C-terminal domain-containing protein [Paeniglutamicibacter kerguelensis]MBP2387842.1 hypothetical protein [Paeniglutamicibacter kerguelensis]